MNGAGVYSCFPEKVSMVFGSRNRAWSIATTAIIANKMINLEFIAILINYHVLGGRSCYSLR